MIPEVHYNSDIIEILWFIGAIASAFSTVLCLVVLADLIRLKLVIPSFDAFSFYIITIIYLNLIGCGLFDALFRSNIIISISSFPICTHLVLTIFQLLWCFGKMSTTLYYIYRLHIIFDNSMFKIKQEKIIFITIFTIFSGIAGIILLPIVSWDTIELAISKHNYKHCQIGSLNKEFTILSGIEGVLHGLVNIILIILFIKRLLFLIQTMVPNKAIRDSINKDIDIIDDVYDDNLEESQREISKRKTSLIYQIAKQNMVQNMSKSRIDISKIKFLSDEMSQKRIEEMTRLMSKQTILVILYIISTSFIFFGQIIWDNIGYLVSFDIIINILCIFLSLKYADKYWNILVKCCLSICCCCCCECCNVCYEDHNTITQRNRNVI